MLLTNEELNRLSREDREAYEGADAETKQESTDWHRQRWAEGMESVAVSGPLSSRGGAIGFWLMIGGAILVLIGFFFDVGVGSEFDRVVNIGKMGEKFAFIFIGLGTLITGSIFWNADRIVKATQAR
jgi:hypothetical protein